ncbi:MAG TPA: hypothetical protein VIM92_03785 [Rhodanobacteraceae bacterium]
MTASPGGGAIALTCLIAAPFPFHVTSATFTLGVAIALVYLVAAPWIVKLMPGVR